MRRVLPAPDRCGLGPATMGVLAGGSGGSVLAEAPARIMVRGGEAIGSRHIDWNFVSSTRERIEQAGATGRRGALRRFPATTRSSFRCPKAPAAEPTTGRPRPDRAEPLEGAI